MKRAAICVGITCLLLASFAIQPRYSMAKRRVFSIIRIMPGRASDAPADWSVKGTHQSLVLFNAIQRGDTGLIEDYVSDGLLLTECIEWQHHCIPTLSFTMLAKQGVVVRYLIEQGADVDQMSSRESRTERGERRELFSPLMYAASWGYVEGARLLVEEGADVNAPGVNGITALMIAAVNNDSEMVRLLLDAGASVEDQLDEEGDLADLWPIVYPGATALWLAARGGHEEVVRLLMAAGADPSLEATCENVREVRSFRDPCAAGDIARYRGHAQLAAIIEGGAEVRAEPDTALEVFVPDDPNILFRQLKPVFKEDDVKTLRAYLEAGLDVDVESTGWGKTLLTEAAKNGAAAIVELLVNRLADVDLMPVASYGEDDSDSSEKGDKVSVPGPITSPLMSAVKSGCTRCFEILLAAGADVNAVTRYGETALITAALQRRDRPKHMEFIRKLVTAGADVEAALEYERQQLAPRVDGATAAWIAAANGNNDLLQLLHDLGASLNAEAYCGKEKKALIGERLCSPRRIAELNGRDDTATLIGWLIGDSGVEPEPRETDITDMVDIENSDGELHAHLKGMIKDDRLGDWRDLVEGGLDPDTLIDEKVPLVSLAAQRGANRVLHLLLEKGADPNRMSLGPRGSNFLFWTKLITTPSPERKKIPVYSPLMYASFAGNLEAVELLLEAGADESARGAAGYTALMAAAVKNRPMIVKKLVDAGAYVNDRLSKEGFKRYILSDGATALWLAAAEGSLAAVAVLLQSRADPAIEAECRVRSVDMREETCDARQIALLKNNLEVSILIDNHLRR